MTQFEPPRRRDADGSDRPASALPSRRTVGGLTLGLLSACLLLTACPSPTKPPGVTPSAIPSFASPTPVPSAGAYSDSGIQVAGGSLIFQLTADNKPLANAAVKLYGPTLALGVSDGRGQVMLGPLAEGKTYRVVVEAPNRATYQGSDIEVKKSTTTTQAVDLGAGLEVSGQVLDKGAAVAGAVVSDGLNTALTDAEGRYTLRGIAAGSTTLTASKPRYQTVSRELDLSRAAAGIDLALTAAEPLVYFDDALGAGVPLASFSKAQAKLRDAGWTISSLPPARDGVWVLISPTKAPDAPSLERLSTFVAQGGKLVLLGEWGGFGRFSNPGANAVLHAVGLHVNPDLLREPANAHPEWLTIKRFPAGVPALAGVSALDLYQSASVFGLTPMVSWGQTTPSTYHVQANATAGTRDVLFAGPFKGGKAIVVGDASAFSDVDTDGDGIANVMEADNMRLWTQLLDW